MPAMVPTKWDIATRWSGLKIRGPTAKARRLRSQRFVFAAPEAVAVVGSKSEGRPSKKRKAPEKPTTVAPAPWLHVDEHVSLKSASPVLAPAPSPFSPSLTGLRGPRLSDGSLVRLEASPSAAKKAKLAHDRDSLQKKKKLKTAAASDPNKEPKAPPRSAGAKEKSTGGAGPCDRCDGAHESSQCPIFKKPRENHPDALRRKPIEIGKAAGNFVLKSASVVRQPGDGTF